MRMAKQARYFSRLIDSKDPADTKRFVLIAALLHYVVTGFLATIFAFLMIIVKVKGGVDKDLLAFLAQIFYYDFWIILGTAGLVATDSFVDMFIKKFQVAGAIGLLKPAQAVGPVTNVENMSVGDQGAPKKEDEIFDDQEKKDIIDPLKQSLKQEPE